MIAGPLGAEEDILYADLDLEVGVRMKLRHDFAGHSNRPDVFQLRVNGRPARILEVEGAEAPPPLAGADQQRLLGDAGDPGEGGEQVAGRVTS